MDTHAWPPATEAEWAPLPVQPSLLGESPFWHPDEQALYWVDIPGKALHRWQPDAAEHRQWDLPSEAGCCAPLPDGRLLLAMRDGLFRFDPASGERERLAAPPYDPAKERFNDGKADAQGRFWVSTIYEPRDQAAAALYCWRDGRLHRMAGDLTVGNGLAFAPDGRHLLLADTATHRIDRIALDPVEASLSQRTVWARFPIKTPGQDLSTYLGRPDGAAMDAEGCYWVALFEGQRLLRLAPDGRVLQVLALPVRCATMPCLGGPDGRTLFVTTSRQGRPAEELARQPWAGCVLQTRVDVPGLPVNFARG